MHASEEVGSISVLLRVIVVTVVHVHKEPASGTTLTHVQVSCVFAPLA